MSLPFVDETEDEDGDETFRSSPAMSMSRPPVRRRRQSRNNREGWEPPWPTLATARPMAPISIPYALNFPPPL